MFKHDSDAPLACTLCMNVYVLWDQSFSLIAVVIYTYVPCNYSRYFLHHNLTHICIVYLECVNINNLF